MKIIPIDGIRKIARKRKITNKQIADYLDISPTTVANVFQRGGEERKITVIAFNTALRELIKEEKMLWLRRKK